MLSSIRLALSLTGTTALALASTPFGAARAEDPKVAQAPVTAQDLGVMDINLRDAVKLNYGFQGALQGAGTPNQAGLGAFIPLHVGTNSVAFVDVLVNANFNDYGNYSSLINTTVAGTTFSTSTRLGYRWLNSNRSWMFGVNAGDFQESCHSFAAIQAAWIKGSASTGSGSSVGLFIHTSAG